MRENVDDSRDDDNDDINHVTMNKLSMMMWKITIS